MNANTPPRGRGRRSLPSWIAAATFGLAVLLSITAAHAAAPPANSLIGNQAAAAYTDAAGTAQTATSNLVQTLVQQVGSFTLTADNTKTSAPGNTLYMPHTLTNLGNGADTFVLQLTNNAGTFDFSGFSIYLDTNGDGLPDSATPLVTGATAFTTPSLAPNGTFMFVVALTVPGSATNAQTDNVTVTGTAGTPALYTTPTATNTDTVTVLTAAPIFQVTKSISVSSGGVSAASCAPTYAAAGCVKATYTLTYTNIGTAVGSLFLGDLIANGMGGTSTGMQYIAGSAKWSGSATAPTDGIGGDPPGIDYQVGGVVMIAVVASIDPNVTGTLTFEVGIKSTATVGTSTTTNTASYRTAMGTTLSTDAANFPFGGQYLWTNESSYTVLATYSVIANNGAATAGVPNDGDNTTAAGNDLVQVASGAAGSTVSFSNTIWNTGNTSDTFNIVAGGSNFPSGTVIALYKSDGITQLTDSNGDGTPDTGPVAAGGQFTVILKAALPGSACPSGVCPSGPFNVTKTATSVGDSTQANKVFDQLLSMTPPAVSLGNGTSAPGTTWAGGVAPAVTTIAVNAGATASFDLVVNNTGSVGDPSDTYTLQYSATNFSAGTVPAAGWTVEFRSGLCSASGSVITSVGPIAASTSAQVCAVVTTLTGSAAGTSDVYFRAISGATGASAVKRDAVTINTIATFTLTPANSGQVYPGGTVVYPHTVTNTGNITCGPTIGFATSSSAGWGTPTLYLDVNGNGQIDAGDTVITGLTTALPAGGTQKILVVVQAPGGASAGATDVLTIVATDASAAACGSSTTTDTSTVITGQLRLDKQQALDSACDGTADAAFSALQISAKPGECVIYRIVATNQGVTSVTNVSITDATPTYTTYNTGPTCTSGTASAPAVGAAGTVACNSIATIAPGGTATMTFGVKIDQ